MTIAPDQMLALKGLASNVRGLIRCVDHRHAEQRSRILLALDGDDDDDDGDSRALLAFRGDDSLDRPEARLLRTAATGSKMKLLGDKRVQRRTLKSFAKPVSAANAFVSQVRLQADFGANQLEYLPREFTRLGLAERKRLVGMLSW